MVKLAEREGFVDSAGRADLKLLEDKMVGTYNGYCFNIASPGEGHSVLNPWDVLNVVKKSQDGYPNPRVWAPHWVNSAGRSLLPHLTSPSYLRAGAYGGIVPWAALDKVDAQQIASLPSTMMGSEEIEIHRSVPAIAVNNLVLLQAGYLTLKGISESGMTVAPPNKVVGDAIRDGLASFLVRVRL